MINNNFLISIITPVRNGQSYVERYLDSLLRQTYTNWEVIIVDDNSSDNGIKLIKNRVFNDNRFIFIKINKNKSINSPYLARNIGLDLAKGEYICFFDIDDYWLPNKLSHQIKILRTNKDIKLIFSSYYRFIYQKNKYFLRKPLILYNLKNTLNYINPIPMVDACIKKETIKNTRFQPIYHEDYLFWQEIVNKILDDNIYIDNQPNSIYIVNNKSLSSSKISVIFWIWRIYKKTNKSLLLNFLKIFIRGLLQILVKLKEVHIKNNKKTQEFKFYK